MRNITLRLSDGDYQVLCEQAERNHTTPTSFVRELIMRSKQRDDIPMLATAIVQALQPHLSATEERLSSLMQSIPSETTRVLQQAAQRVKSNQNI